MPAVQQAREHSTNAKTLQKKDLSVATNLHSDLFTASDGAIFKAYNSGTGS